MRPIRKPFNENYSISQLFGKNPQIYKQFGLKGHNGLDYATPIATHLYALGKGTVMETGNDPKGYGHYIRINYDDGFQSLYAHSDTEPMVKKYDRVIEDQFVMSSGNSGFSTGAHLHFGIRELDSNGGVINYNNGFAGYIDPKPWLDKYAEWEQSQIIPDWAENPKAKAIESGIITKWDNPNADLTVEDWCWIFFKLGWTNDLHKIMNRCEAATMLDKQKAFDKFLLLNK